MEDKFIEQYINRKSSEYASVMLQIESDEKLSNLIYDYSEMIQIESDKNYAKSISGRSSKSSKKEKKKAKSKSKTTLLISSSGIEIEEKIEEVINKKYKEDVNMKNIMNHPQKNIGVIGMVSEGKSTLTKSVSNQVTQRSKEEMERNITMKVGYADTKIWKKNGNYISEGYNNELIDGCSDEDLIDHISIVDCPGHYGLIAMMISSVRLMHAVIVVVSVEGDLESKTSLIEHLKSVKLSGIKNIIVCLNKIDLFRNNKNDIIKKYNELEKFLEKYEIEPIYPIIPTSFENNIGTDFLLDAIGKINKEESIDDNYFLSNRSFSITRPGTVFDKVIGSCIGGSLLGGNITVGDEIEIRPGLSDKKNYVPLSTFVTSLRYNNTELDSITRGGLISIGTQLIPSIAANNGLSGKLVGKKGTLPSVYKELVITDINNELFGKVWNIDSLGDNKVSIQFENQLVTSKLKEKVDGMFVFALKDPICIAVGKKVTFLNLKNKKNEDIGILGIGTFVRGNTILE